MHSKLIIAISALASLVAAIPTETLALRGTGEVVTGQAASTGSGVGGKAVDKYTYFKGDGSTGAGWPSKAKWASFDALWTANEANFKVSCGNNHWGADDSSTELSDMKAAIIAQAAASKVDERFILSVIAQESVGCVRVATTHNPGANPGLMQSHNGASCVGITPCPKSKISQMVADGTSGTASGDGLAANINQAQQHLGDKDISQIFYAAARLYNSGTVEYSNLDNAEGATGCYSSDIANRLLGWVNAKSSCTAPN